MKQTKFNKNWIAVIPAVILYDPKLTDKDKIVYSVISNLTHEKGYCWASNAYIADLLSCAPLTISRSVSNLNKRGYVKNSVEKNKEGTLRKIYLGLSNLNNGVIKNDKRVSQKSITNNITNNIVDNNINNISNELLCWINQEYKRKFSILNKNKLKQRLKTFGIEKIKTAVANAYADEYHIKNNFKYLTPEYFLRSDENLDKWLNVKKEKNERTTSKFKKPTASSYAENISKELGW
jgi:hypothetical protein